MPQGSEVAIDIEAEVINAITPVPKLS